MRFRVILSALLCLFALFSTSLADVTNNVPTSVSGGSGAVSAIQTDDGISYDAPQGSAVNIGGFTAVGGDISSVVLHVKFSVDPGYAGTNPIQANGINTPIIPTDGDTQRAASVEITSGNFKVNTWPEITALAVSFFNNDDGSGQSVHIDHAYLVINHTTPLFAPPTWSDEFDDSGPPNPAVWTFEQGLVRNQEVQCYQSNNAWQQNGNLIIEGRREQVLNPNYIPGSTDWRFKNQYAQYTSASITSQGKYSFQYGRMQVRAKLPCVPGAWPAIWTLGNSGEWPSNGECDVLEYYSPDSVLANLARGSNTRWSAAWDSVKKPLSPLFTSTNPNPNWRTEYHIWTMQWDQDNIRLYIDNHLMNTTAQTWLVNPVTTWGPKNPFKQPHFLLLNLALGGAGGDPSGTTFPLRYELDHVRVWEGLTGNNAPTDIALSSNTVPEGLPSGTVVGNLTATDVDAAEVHSFSLVAGAGDTHNASFEVVFNSDQTKTSVLRTKAVLSSADGLTRSIRVRVTDIEGATYDKALTVQLAGQYVIEVAPATLSVPEGGNNTFDVRLRVAPAADVTVNVSRLSGDSDLSVAAGNSLVFTPGNATVWQTVTLAAAEDTDRINGTATFRCNDASGLFLNATVLATEADNEPPPTQALVTISNLNQTFDGYMKSVTVTTTVAGVPQNLSCDLTYGGQFMPPTDAGSYEIVATITDPDYQGSASGTLVIAKAAQTINFAALDPVPYNATPFALTAAASSGLTVSYASSNTNVATVSGNTVTIIGAGTTTITASQAGNDNYNSATAVPQTLTVEAPESLTWDANGTAALQTDGGGGWTSPGQWWNGSTNVAWESGRVAIFGNGSAGGAVTLANPTTIYSLTFNSFTGTYTLGTSGQTMTLNNGMTANAGSGAITIVSPLTLGAAQSWTNNSTALLSIGPDAITNGGFLLSVGGTGNTTVSGAIGGAGGLTKSGAGTLRLSGSSSYGGATTVSNGTLVLSNANTISAATSIAATGTLQLGHATSMGSSTMTLASGAILQLRNDVNTIFTAPIATAPTTGITYNFDVNNAGSAATGKTLSLANLTFATSTTGTITNQINITGGNTYTLGLGTISAPSNGAGTYPVIVNATTAGVTIAKFSAGSYGNALTLQGGNNIRLNNFESGSNSVNTVTISGATTVATLGATAQTNNRSGGSLAYTLTSGALNLTTTTSLANVYNTGTASAPTFTITSGTLNNTSGAALTLAANSGVTAGSPNITIGGNFTFGAADSTSANDLNLGAGTITNAGNRTITFAGTGTTLTMGGTMTNTSNAIQTSTVNGSGNTLSLGGYALSSNTTSRINVINGSGNVNITGAVTNGGTATASGLTYSGTGILTLGGQNTYAGNTTVSSGTLSISSTGGIYTTGYTFTPTVTVSSGATLQMTAWAYGANGGLKNLDAGAARLLVNGGTITYTGSGEGQGNQNNGRLFTIGTGGATLNAAGTGTWFIEPYASYDSTTGQVIPSGLTLTLTGVANGKYTKFITGNGALTKSGSGTWTLAGANTYTGATNINGGTLVITGATQKTSAINFAANSSLGLVIGSPVTITTAAVNFTNGRISLTGTPSTPSHVLLTALSFTGTPVLASPVPGYALQIVGNQLQLNQVTYGTWESQITNGLNLRADDADGDSFTNLQEFLFGTSPMANNGSLVSTTPGSGNLVLRWLQLEAGATYTLKQCTTLEAGSWTAVASPTPTPDSDQSGAPAGYAYYTISLTSDGQRLFFIIEGAEN